MVMPATSALLSIVKQSAAGSAIGALHSFLNFLSGVFVLVSGAVVGAYLRCGG